MRNVILSVVGSMLLVPMVQANDFNEIFRDTGDRPGQIYLQDLNNDGNRDLLAFDYRLSNGNTGTRGQLTMHPYIGGGDGSFSELATSSLQSPANTQTLADMNGDGYVELLSDRFYLGNGDGTFASNGISANSSCASSLVRDLNADGFNDLICSEYIPSLQEFRLVGYINEGRFVFQRGSVLPTNNTFDRSVSSITQGDLNGDGVADIVRMATIRENIRGPNSATGGHIFTTNLASGNWFGEPLEWTTNDLHDENNAFATDFITKISLADFNNDGNSDLLILIEGSRGNPAPSLVVYTGDGTGLFNTEKIDTRIGDLLRASSDLHVVDLNDDGNQDVVVSFFSTGNDSPALNTAVFYGNGDGTFETAQEITPGLRNVRDIAIGDVDGDGQLDIAVFAGWDFGTLAVFSRNQSSTPVPTIADGVCLFAGSDADGDGWGWESGRSCRVTAQSLPGTGGRPTNGFTFQNVSNYPPCILEDSDPDEDGWGWEDSMSCIFGSGTITTFDVQHPNCQSAASDSDGDGWGWENNASCRVSAE